MKKGAGLFDTKEEEKKIKLLNLVYFYVNNKSLTIKIIIRLNQSVPEILCIVFLKDYAKPSQKKLLL